MKNIKITQNKILILIIIMLGVLAIFIQNKNYNKKELYKLSTECTEQALSFVKQKNEPFYNWDLLQSKYDSEENICFAEMSAGQWSYIYNLTYSKLLASEPPLLGEVNEFYADAVNRYKKLNIKIFGEEN